MDIRTFLSEAPRGTAAKLAVEIGVHPVMVSQWSAGLKSVPVERCTAVEQFSHGAVMRWDLRPEDWHRIWPELMGAAGAPAPSEPVEAKAA